MTKISGGYVAINPNFVISDIKKKSSIDNELDGLVAIVKNILLRGAPTKPSVFLESKIGKIEKQGKYYYTRSTRTLEWERTIKGTPQSKPALEFYKLFCEKYPEDASCFLPECQLNFIVYDEKDDIPDDCQVDFYSPFNKLSIEVDGKPYHEKENQILSDNQRDNLIREAGVISKRIKAEEATNETKLKEIKEIIARNEIIDRNNKIGYITEENISLECKKYMYAIRIQLLILELISKGYLDLNDSSLSIALKTIPEQENIIAKEALEFAWEDLKLYFKNLCILLNKEISFPKILTDESSDIVVDIDLYSKYDERILFDDSVIQIRNDYFPYDKDMYGSTTGNTYVHDKYCQYKNYYTVVTSDLRFPNVSPDNPNHKSALEFFLKNIFGHEGFRPNQLEIVANALNPENGVVGLLPTGSGKSVCFQLVSFLTPGITLVISPLKLLMDDQTKNLYRRNLIMSAYQIHGEKRENIRAFRQGQTKILYVTPEKFFNDTFTQLVNDLPIGQIAIDEVHCLSEWGHDFRTSYLLLMSFLSSLPDNILLMGTSATASPRVINDIEKEFFKAKPNCFKRIQATSIKRPELSYNVIKANCQDAANKHLENVVRNNIKQKEKTLVFCAYTSTVDDVQKYLTKQFPNTQKYYATYKAKDEAFQKFTNDNSNILIATKAFGMGIDVPNIRETVHYDIASSVESLYQEMGRAGRDQKPSKCNIMLIQGDVEKKRINQLFSNPLSISTLKYIQKCDDEDISDPWLSQYGAIGKQLFLLLNNTDDYNDWGEFVYSVYLFIRELGNKNFLLSDFKNFIEKSNCDIEMGRNFDSKLDKALYKLYTLGIINLWGLYYSNGIGNPQYSNISLQNLSSEEIQNNLINHIRKYDFRYEYLGGKEVKDYITALCKWDNDTFLHYRWESLKTLYYMILEFQSSEDFANRIENFFVESDDLRNIIENPTTTCSDCMHLFFEISTNILKDQMAKFSAEYQNNLSIDFMQGMVAIQNGELDKLKESKLALAMSNEMSKSDTINNTFVEECLKYFRDNKKAQKRFLVFVADNFPKKLNHKQIRNVLKTFDTLESEQLLDRPQYNKIYASLEKLKITLGDNK